MTQNNHCTLFISINKDNKIKYIIKNNDNIIQEQTEYLPISISFDMNEIIIHQQKENSIDFINDFVNNPNEFKEYSISYQGKEYEVIAEVLLSLILHQYKNQIEKKYIIKNTIVQNETEEENIMLEPTTPTFSFATRFMGSSAKLLIISRYVFFTSL